MKIGLLLLLVAVVLGGLVGTLVVRDPGYVLITYADYALETSLWFGVLVLVVAYIAIRFVVFVLSRSAASGGRFGDWLHERRSRTARQRTVQGLLLMAEGEWAEARKVLIAAAGEATSPLINYLNAARAAHALRDLEDRDALLRKAHESTPGSRFAVALTQAELQMDAGQWEQSLATLLKLRSESPRHKQVTSMLARCYRQLGDWQALIELMPDLKKLKVQDEAAATALAVEAWSGRIREARAAPQPVWQAVPKELKRNAALVVEYARTLVAAGAADEAEAVVRSALQQRWDDVLVTCYGRIVSEEPARQLLVAEQWVKERPNDAKLLLALGRICLMNRQWEKAREYFEVSLRLERSEEVYGELGRLCCALGDIERGSEYVRLSSSALPDLPLPSP